jgi:hypothetical protein
MQNVPGVSFFVAARAAGARRISETVARNAGVFANVPARRETNP